MTWRFPATRCGGCLGAVVACLAGLAVAGCYLVSAVNSARQPKAAGLTRQQIALATHIARHEIAKQGSHIRIAVAQLHPGIVRWSNTGHTCNSGTLLRVTMIGSFPHTMVTPTPGGDSTVHAEVVEANPRTGQE